MVQTYITSLAEYLDEDRVRFDIVEPDGFIEEHSLVIKCLGGWSSAKNPPKNNSSYIYYGNAESKNFAERMRETLSDWGKCYVDLGHRVSGMTEDETICRKPNTISVSISPFKLNGPNYETYMSKLQELGRCIESCIFAYLISKSQAPKMMNLV